MTITERDALVRVDQLDVELRVVEANDAWYGHGKVGDRWVFLRCSGVAPEDISLRTVADLETLPAARWA